jgi:hypothetical protein
MTTGEPVMPEQAKSNRSTSLRSKLVLSATALLIIAEAVGASSLPDDLLRSQEQLIALKQAPPVMDDTSIVIRSSSASETLPSEVSHKADKMRMVQFMPRPDFTEAAPFGLMVPPPFPAGSPGFAGAPPPKFSPRAFCLEDINRQMAGYAHTKSRLQLNDSQKAAWRTVEDALDVSTGKLRVVCETLPNEIVGPPGIIEGSDFLEKLLAARLEMVRALKAPLQQLIGQLTPDQRASLDAPPLFPPF